jgi:hypothetical protein
MVKLAFGYKRRVGKDTSCDYLIKKYGGVKLSFAEPLYKILNFAQEVCNFEKNKDRKFLQFIGTEWARTINNDVWINLLVKKIDESSNVFVSDLRFKNEFQVLKDAGFTTIQIKNINAQTDDGFTNHQSDLDLDCAEWDYTIENVGSVKDLYTKLDEVYGLFSNK